MMELVRAVGIELARGSSVALALLAQPRVPPCPRCPVCPDCICTPRLSCPGNESGIAAAECEPLDCPDFPWIAIVAVGVLGLTTGFLFGRPTSSSAEIVTGKPVDARGLTAAPASLEVPTLSEEDIADLAREQVAALRSRHR